ncbi:MAG: D-alanine--D-alanine ligase [Ruminococcaceae bacterium]|nr:D-alanine--D-alanine ligase [Oscillospiraceae bacterium]
MKNVLVLFGGCSSEHDISLISASSVIKNTPKEKYNVLMMGITRNGRWYLYEGDVDALPNDKWLETGKLTEAFVSPDRKIHGITVCREGKYENIHIDIAFPVLHGKNGEDGTIQGLFQLAGIPFVGCDMTSSAISMDKIFTNIVADANGIAQAKWDYITKYDFETGEKTLDDIVSKLGFPIFVKPANAGSSVGISKVYNNEELKVALYLAFEYDTRVLFEEFIDGYEVECAVLGNDEIKTGVVGQITPANEFYDYDAKYINTASILNIPALVSKEKQEEVKSVAIKTFKAVGGIGFARVDFFIAKEDNRVLFNEINTIPGFTSISMYPKMIEAAGISYEELCDTLLTLALEKWGINS